jgi:hypothetical protein
LFGTAIDELMIGKSSPPGEADFAGNFFFIADAFPTGAGAAAWLAGAPSR